MTNFIETKNVLALFFCVSKFLKYFNNSRAMLKKSAFDIQTLFLPFMAKLIETKIIMTKFSKFINW